MSNKIRPCQKDLQTYYVTMSPRKYTVTDGKLVLYLEPCREGGYTVTAPFEPGLVTEAETVSEAFEMARDAMISLRVARRKLLKKSPMPRRVAV